MRGYLRTAAVAAMGIAGAAALTVAVNSRVSAIQTCTDSFTNSSGGAWSAPGNWSNNAAPTNADDACIGDITAGTYTVTVGPGSVAHSITVGGTLSGTQTLNIQGGGLGGATLGLGAGASTIKTNGAMVLDSTNGNLAQVFGTTTLTNHGSVSTVQDGGGVRYLQVPLTNAANGTVTIGAADTRADNNTLTTNAGQFTVALGGQLALSTGSSFTNSGGTLTANGTFVEVGGTFTESGGNEAGTNAAVIQGATLADSAGTGSFRLQGNNTVSGTIPSGQTVSVIGNGAGNSNATLSGTVTNKGSLLLDSTNGNFALIGGGALDNQGTLKTLQNGGGVRYIETPVTNEPTGTIEIASADTRQDSATLTTNKGAFTIDNTCGFALTTSSSFTNTTGGTLTANGSFSEIGGTFTESGGTEAGTNAAVIQNASMVDSAGTGAFILEAVVGLSGTIPSGQTVTALGSGAGNANLTLTGTVTNNGTLLLDSNDGNFAALETGAAGALDNKGTLRTIADAGGTRYIEVNVTNEVGATVEIGTVDTRVDAANTIVNNGAFTIDSGFGIALTAGSSFTNSAGTLTANGSFVESGGTFTQSGGIESGPNAAVIQSASLVDSAGTGAFILEATTTLTGTIPSGQTVTVLGSAAGNANTPLNGTVTNNGTLLLDSNDGNFAALETGTAGALDNKGTLKTIDDAHGTRYFEVNVTNEAGATIEIGTADTRVDTANTIVNKGAFTIDSGFGIALTAGSSFTNSAGTLTANGNFIENAGTFTENGGAEAGTNAAVIQGATLVDSAGTGAFILEASDTVSGTIPSGQTVTVLGSAAGNASATLSGTVTNIGSLVLDSNDGNFALINGGTLDNKGTLKTLQDAGGPRYFEAPITNEAGASILINSADTRQDAGTLTANSGTIALGDGAHLVLSGGSTITNAASSTTGATINGTTNATSTISGGGISLAGTLQVTTVGTPAVGNSYQPINSTVLSGTFSTLKYGSADYDTAYSASAVTLTVGNPFVLTGKHVTATEDTPANKVKVATWTDDDQAGSTYTATINWGDSSQSAGLITTTGTGGMVKGTHTWTTPGTFTITTTVTDSTGTTLVVTSTATVHAAPPPTVTAVAPPKVAQGGSANLVLTGTGFTADSSVTFSATGISVGTFTFVNSTQVKVHILTTTTATLGAGNVSVTTDGGTGTCTGCLTVDARPKVTTASPNLPHGQTTIETVTGTGFQVGLTVATNIPGATVGAPQGVTATSFTVSITVPAGATPATYKLTVHNPDGGSGDRNCLVVT